MKKIDKLGDRQKQYEMETAGRMLIPLLPIMIRLDGKCFSHFTKGLERPYDKRLADLMIELTKLLVEETNALIGFTESDEISLLVYSEDSKSQTYFNGRIQKIESILAGFASSVFNFLLPKYIPEKVPTDPRKVPVFDCRVWNTPTKMEASNALLWREQDATKNAVTMAAQCYYSHKQLDGKNSKEKQEMLFQKGINFNDYPSFFKRGTFIRREKKFRKFSAIEIDKLPKNHEARKNPDLTVERNEIVIMDMPPFSKVVNRVEVIFDGASPIIENKEDTFSKLLDTSEGRKKLATQMVPEIRKALEMIAYIKTVCPHNLKDELNKKLAEFGFKT